MNYLKQVNLQTLYLKDIQNYLTSYLKDIQNNLLFLLSNQIRIQFLFKRFHIFSPSLRPLTVRSNF